MVPDRWCDEPAVSCCWQTHPGMGCGIRRTSGDKVTIEEQTKTCITGCAHVGERVCYVGEVCFVPRCAVFFPTLFQPKQRVKHRF